MITKEQAEYLIDFITKVLQDNEEDDPFDLDEVDFLLEIKRNLKQID